MLGHLWHTYKCRVQIWHYVHLACSHSKIVLQIPRNHLVLSEHLTFSHSRDSHRCHFVDTGGYAVIGEGGVELIKCGEVGRDARGGVPLLSAPFCLVFELLRHRHLDHHFLS